MDDAARQARNRYVREWRKKNPDKEKRARERYWAKKAKQAADLNMEQAADPVMEQTTDPDTEPAVDPDMEPAADPAQKERYNNAVSNY